MVVKNQEIVVTIENTGMNGEGIARYQNMAVFIPYSLVGEKVRAKVILVKKKYAVAKLLEVLTPAEERVRPLCPVFTRCGGCQMQHIKYCSQTRIKAANVKDTLNKVARINAEVNPCIKSDYSYNYRNKLQLPVGNKNGLIQTGFYAEFSHDIVPVDSCALHPEWADKLIAAVKEFMQASQIKGYDESKKEGIIRHLVARELCGQIMITLVINANSLNCDFLINSLKKLYPYFGLYLNINKEDTNVITSRNFIHIYGLKTLKDDYCGIKYEIGPDSFMQINNSVKDKLYYKVMELVKDEKDPVIIDAYSGAGLLSALMARYAQKVYGIEISEEASLSAEKLIEANNLQGKMISITGDCGKKLPPLLKELKNDNTILVLDPPRKGCEKSIVKAIHSRKPNKIIYISCNPSTLARDLGMICGTLEIDGESSAPNPDNFNNLYDITLVQPFDMFPQTRHVETLVCLERR